MPADRIEPRSQMVIENAAPTGAGQRLRVLLAMRDIPMLNVALRSVIDAQPDMEVVGEVEGGEPLREHLERTTADVIVTEHVPLGGPDGTTAETIEAIRAARPGMKILAWACRSSSDQFSLALKAGADGFLTREAQPTDIVSALRCIFQGETYVSPSIVTRMVNTYLLKNSSGSIEDPYDQLSDREREVFLLAAVGHTNREIAKSFHLSEQTIHNYRACVMEKLGFHDRVDLLKYAIRRGVINVADL